MPLINCPECKKEISDAAPACPHCGNPKSEEQPANKGMKKRTAIVSWLFGVVVLLVGLLALAKQPISGVCLIAISLLLIPPACSLIENKINFALTFKHKGAVIFLFFVFFVIFLPENKEGENTPTKSTGEYQPGAPTKTPSKIISLKQPKKEPQNTSSYEQANAEVGCKSKYSDNKKEDIFNSKYKNHWFTWSGTVFLAESGEASINTDDFGTQDLTIDFADPKAGYDLTIDSKITVKFLMKSSGGCFLPFTGEKAVILN